MPKQITISLAERQIQVPAGTTLYELRARHKPDADITVMNGAPVQGDCALSNGDEIVLIRRGETPAQDELEALMAARHTPGVHEKLKRACVGIAGVGGLGSSVAIALARVGVGELVIADYDVVEPSNLNRQQFFVDQIGKRKVYALRENLSRINPYVKVTAHYVRLDPENIAPLFEGADVMVEAFDLADQKLMLTEAFSEAFPDIPLVVATGLAGFESSNTVVTKTVGKNLVVVGDQRTAAAPGTGLMAPRVGVAAHHQANAVLRLLLGLPAAD